MHLSILHEPGLPGLVLSPLVVIGLRTLEISSDSSESRTGQWNEVRCKSRCVERQVHAVCDGVTDAQFQQQATNPSAPKCNDWAEHQQPDKADHGSEPTECFHFASHH